MNKPEARITVQVDVTNPGQFFACCGLLELAHRMWPGAEGWFDQEDSLFKVSVQRQTISTKQVIDELCQCEISGLLESESEELDELEKEKRELAKDNSNLTQEKEHRRQELGKKARSGSISLKKPFELDLDWWMNHPNGTVPPTWSGQQKPLPIIRSCQAAMLKITDYSALFDYGCILRPVERSNRKKVEPFYFDARRFAHALDTGFSLDEQKTETIAHPAVELLSLVGLQRFRPSLTHEKWNRDYCIWTCPLAPSIARSVFSGTISNHLSYRFRFPIFFRDDEKRYKAFGFATPVGEEK